jgi:hypothetical protein
MMCAVLVEVIGAAVAVLVAALPPPPDKVVRETRSYGTVTIDHKAHLSLRGACKACHGPGRVGKFSFTPRAAHDACRACHTEMARGPTTCRGCHVVAPKKELVARPAEAAPAGDPAAPSVATVAMATGPGASPTPMTPSHVPTAPGPPALTPATAPTSTPFLRAAEFGLLSLVGERQDLVVGPSLQLMGRVGGTVITYTMAHAGGSAGGRTHFLIGGGREFSVAPTVRATALAVGGLDATHDPVSAMPALGLRGGVEWSSRSRWSVGFSVTALTDVVQRGSLGDRTGGTTVGFTMSACRSLAWR